MEGADENRLRNVEKNRIFKFYTGFKRERISAKDAIKEVNKLRPNLKYPESLVFLEEVLKRLEEHV